MFSIFMHFGDFGGKFKNRNYEFSQNRVAEKVKIEFWQFWEFQTLDTKLNFDDENL